MLYAFFVAFVAASVPLFSYASIYISEVAWMGSTDNANAEWIELYNAGPSQNLDGWTLSALDGQPNINLSGLLSANSYALLERTSDDTVPGVAAFLVYTGALGNAGEILELRDASGTLIDRVDGSEGWVIGGDNSTKDTLQRSGNPPIGAFITAPSTPGVGGGVVRAPDVSVSQNSAPTSVPSENKGTTGLRTIESSTVDGGTVRVRLLPALTLVVPSEQTVTAGVPAVFRVQAFREGGAEVDVHEVTWNFGDGTVMRGIDPTHTYRFTGSYAVTVEGRRTNFNRDLFAQAHMVVHVVEPSIEILGATDDFVEIRNAGNVDVDLSSFILVAGNARFRIPEGTRILAQSAVRFHSAVTGLSRASRTLTTLLHPSGAVFATHRNTEPVVLANTVPAPPTSVVVPVATTPRTTVQTVSQDAEVVTEIPKRETALLASTIQSSDPSTSSTLWWSVLALVAGVIAVYVMISVARREREDDPLAGIEIESEEDSKK
jgi:hypothetical protein